MTSESMDFPQVHICTSQGFRPNVLKDMGLKEDSMKFAQFTTYYESVSLGDIQEVWDNATYSTDEFALTWMTIEGIVFVNPSKHHKFIATLNSTLYHRGGE